MELLSSLRLQHPAKGDQFGYGCTGEKAMLAQRLVFLIRISLVPLVFNGIAPPALSECETTPSAVMPSLSKPQAMTAAFMTYTMLSHFIYNYYIPSQ